MTDQLRVLEEELAENPGNPEVFAQLSDQLWAANDWRSVLRLHVDTAREAQNAADWVDFAELVDRLKGHADALEDGPEKSKIWLAIGDLYLNRIGADEDGMDAYQKAFKVYPHDVTPLRRAREIYRRRGDWKVLLDVYNIEIRVVSEREERIQMLLEIAQIQAEHLGQFEAASETLERISKQEGEDDPLAVQLQGFYARKITAENGIREALSRAEQALNAGPAEAAADAFIEAAQLEYDRYGGDVEEALRMAEQALNAAPNHDDAQLVYDMLSDELSDDGRPEIGHTAVEEESQAEESQAEESQAEESQAEESQDIEPRTVDGFFASIEAFDGDVKSARAALEQERTNLSALKTVRRELLDQGDIAGLAEILEDSVRYFRKKEGEWEVMTELANIHWLELGDDEQAEYYFKRLKLLDPEHADVFKFYEAYYEDEGNWRKLFTLLSGRLEHIDDREDYRLIVERLSEIAELELDSPEKAIDVWKSFSRKFPDDAEAVRRLRHLYEDHGKWNALVELLKDEVRTFAEGAESEEDETVGRRVSLLEEMAHIYRTHLNLDTMVINIMGQILELDPSHPSAFGQLRDLYESNRRFNDLANLLAEAAERSFEEGNVGMAVGYLREVADIWEERLNNQTQAIPHLARIVEIAPEEVDVRTRLREIYEKRRDFRSLFDLRLQETQLLAGQERLEELDELLELSRDRLRDPEREAGVLCQLLEERPDDLELLDDLEKARTKLEDWDGVARTLERKSELLDAEAAEEALERAARLYREKLGRKDEAIRLWRSILAASPEHDEAFTSLAEIFCEQKDYAELEGLYLEADAPEALFEVLAELAGMHEDETVDHLRRRVRIAEEEIGEPSTVIEALEDLVPVVEEPDEVRRELLEWVGIVDDVEREIELRRVLLDGVEHREEIYSQMLKITDLEESRGREDAALGWAIKAFSTLPGNRTAFERAEELARQMGMLPALLERAEEIAAGLDDEADREMIWAESARIKWHDLDAYEEAIEHYATLRQRHPEEFEFLEALDELYALTEQPMERIEVLETQIELLRDRGAADVDLVDQLSKIADVQRTHLDEAEAARETYSEILDLQPDHLGAVRGKKELQREEERWMDVVEFLLREIPLAAYESPESQWEAKRELADVYRHHLDDLHEALRYYGEILAENPEFEAALEAVRGLLAEDGMARQAAMLLEPIFRDQHQHAPLAEALEARLRVSGDRFEEQEILDELIPLYAEELEDFETAFEHARRQFEIDPERDDIWLRFEQLGARLNRWELIEKMFTLESPLEGHESSTRYDLLRHLAAIREHRLQMVEEALHAWEALHEYDPFDIPALEALQRLYRKTEDVQALVRVLRAHSELVDVNDERVELLVEAGTLLAEVLDDEVEAIDVFRQVLVIDPENDDVLSELEALLRQQERWSDLEMLLMEQSDQTLQPERRRNFLLQLAMLRFEELDDWNGAVSIICELLEDDPGDDEVLAFARTVDDELGADDSHLDLRLDLTRTLEPLYRMRNEYERLDEVLQVRLDGGVGEFEQIEILDELVELRQKRLTNPEGAFEALRRSVTLQPDDEDRRAKLLELASGLERLPDALQTLEDAAQNADPFVAVVIWKRLGKIAIQRLNEPSQAIDYYERAREIDDTDESILESLELLFEATNQSERLCSNLIEQARFASPDKRRDLLRRVATLQDHVLERPLDAIDTYRELLEIDPDDLGVIEALQRLYADQEQYFELVDLLRRKVELVDTAEARIDVLEHWATVAEEELQDLDQTIDVYRQILETNPEHRRSLAELDRLLAAEMQWPQWADIARERLDVLEPDEAQIRLDIELRLAEVYVDELMDIDGAIEIYREVLERNKHQEDAVQALESLAKRDSILEDIANDLVRIYREQSRWRDLADLYERRREQTMNPIVEAEHEFMRAKLLRDQLEESREAMRAFARAWKCQIDEDRYRRELIHLGTELEEWELLVELLDDALEHVIDPELSQELHLMLARLWQDVLDDTMEAETHLREVLTSDPENAEAFGALSEILHHEERWFDLVELLQQRFDVIIADDEQGAIELLMTISGIQEIHLSDSFSAVETLRRVLSIDERFGEAIEELERLLTEQERWEDLGEFYERRAMTSPLPSERMESELALADLCRGPLEQIERAIELYGRALETDSEHERTIESLESLFEQEPDYAAVVAEQLEPIYRARGDHESLVEVLQARVEVATDTEQRIAWLQELLDLFSDAVEDPASAWAVAADLFSDRPTDRRARNKLWDLTARAHGWKALAEVYNMTLEHNLEVDDDLRAHLFLELAGLYADRLEDVPKGREMAEKSLRLRPENKSAEDLLERLLERQEAWHDLAEFYRERAQFSADESRTIYWYEKIATLHEDVLEDIDAAVDVYARLLEISPGNEVYRSAMERILATVERWYELADIYRQRIAGGIDDDVVTENRLALAELLERELGNPEEAVQLYRQILEQYPHHNDAIRALEGMRRDLDSREGEWDPLRRTIIEILLDAYDEGDSWRRIDDLLAQQVELVDEPAEQVEILVRKAQLLLRTTNDDIERVHALLTLSRAFCFDPTNEEIEELIEVLASDLDAWQRIIPIYLRSLGETDDVDRQGHILAAVAKIYEGPLQDRESATAAYQQSVEISAESELALEKLQELYGELEKWDRLVDILERRLEEIYDPDRQQNLRKRIANLYDEKLGQPDEALRLYREIRHDEPTELAHVIAMERLLEATQDYDELEELLIEKLQFVEAQELRLRSLKRLGEIQRDHLGRVDDAIASFREALELVEDDVETLDALIGLYRSAQRWPELLEVMRSRCEEAESVEETNEIELEMGDILREEAQDPEQAFECYHSVLQRDRHNYLARAALFRLLKDDDMRRAAATVLADVHKEEGEWDELEALHQRVIEVSDEPEYRAQQYLQLARIQEEAMEMPIKAFATLSDAMLDVAEVDAVRNELERLAVVLEATEDLIAIYEDALEAGVDDPEIRRKLLLVVGQGYVEQLVDYEGAIPHFESILEIDEYDPDALSWLNHIYQSTKDWPNLARILENEIIVSSGDARVEAMYQLGYLRELVEDDFEEAFELYRKALLDDSDHDGAIKGLERLCEDRSLMAEILEVLEPIYRDHGSWAKLARLFSLKLDVVEDPLDRAALLCRMAEVEFDKLDNVENAFGHWCDALVEDPHDGEVQQRLEEIAKAQQWIAELVDLYEEIASEVGDPVRRLELAEQAALWAMEQLEDAVRAAALYRQVVEVEPEHEEALRVLEDVARSEGDDESLAAVLAARIQSTFEEARQIELYQELASVRLTLADYDGAIEAFQQLLILDGDDLERLETLAQLFEFTERWEDRVDTLERILEYREDEGMRQKTLAEMGSICLEKVGDLQRARRKLEEALRLDGSDREIMQWLEEVYDGLQDWQALDSIISQQLQKDDELDDEERVRLRIRRAQLRYEASADVDGAIEDYQAAFAIRSDHPDIVDALTQLYRSEGRFEDLIALLNTQINQVPDEQAAIPLLLEMAAVSHEELEALERAVEFASTVLEIDPTSTDALDRLEAIHRSRKDWHQVVEIIDHRIEQSTDEQVRESLMRERARTLDEDARAPEAAAQTYEALLDYSPDDTELIDRLEEIYRTVEDGQSLYGLYAHKADRAVNDDERVECYLEMGEVARKYLGGGESRVQALEMAYELSDDDLDIVEPLLDSYIDGERFDQAEPLLDSVIEILTQAREMKEVVRFMHLRGKLAERQGDRQAARSAYEEAQRLDASYIPNLLSLGKLLFGDQDYEAAKKVFQVLLLHQMNIKDDEDKVEVYFHLGAIREVEGDERGARDMYKRALRVIPGHPDTKAALAALGA